MILQRLASAIQNQNWSQIIVEILIVVIGIFLGLQVQAWYDGRQASDEEQRIVGFLISDMEKTVTLLEQRDQDLDRIVNRTAGVIEILESGELRQEDIEGFEEGLYSHGRSPSLFDFLNSFHPENINRIQDLAVRKIIDDYLGEVAGHRTRANTIQLRQNEIKSRILQKATVQRSIQNADRRGDRSGRAFYDFNELKDDKVFLANFITVNGNEILYWNTVKDLLDNSKTILETLQKYRAGEEIGEVLIQ